MAARGRDCDAFLTKTELYFVSFDRKCLSIAGSLTLLVYASFCVMTLAPSCVYKLQNAALHSCTDAEHSVCRVFGLVRLQ